MPVTQRMAKPTPMDDPVTIARRHLQFGWWSLLVFLTSGILLESLLGYKVFTYVAEQYETRRILWRLAHAHGALLSVVHLAFAATVQLVPTVRAGLHRHSSAALMGVSVLLPGGFFFGGLFLSNGEAGRLLVLAAAGGVMLIVGVLIVCLSLPRRND